MGACRPEWIGEPFTTDDLAELYYMIVKYQDGELNNDGVEELREMLNRYLCWAKDVLKLWLDEHGCNSYEEFVNAFSIWNAYAIAERICSQKEDILEVIDYPPEDIHIPLSIPVYTNEFLGISLSYYQLLKDGLRPVYQEFRRLTCNSEIGRKIKKLYNELVAYTKNPTTMKDAILLADRITHLLHMSGNLIEDYGNVDVEEARRMAEEMLND